MCFALCLLTCVPGWCQLAANNAEAGQQPPNDSQLQAPPPVNGQAYPTTFEGAGESNYIRGGVTFTGAFSTDVSGGATPTNDMSYSVWPTLALSKTTDRMHLELDYAPGFTLYQRTTSLNQADQNLTANLMYRLSPNLTATVVEGFQRSSNLFNQPNPLLATTVSGSVPTSNLAIVTPYAETVTSATSAQLAYQLSADAMIGGGGNYGTQTYPSPEQVTGIYNSRSSGGSFFYSTRVHEKNYVGASYQYQNFLSFQVNSPSTESQIQTIFLFYTMYLKSNWSISISGGPQHYNSTQGSLPPTEAWEPMTMVSMNWRGERNTFAASYARTVSGGGGLSGTFNSNDVAFSFGRQLSRNWTAGASGSYSNYQSLTPHFLFSSAGGHTLSGAASLQRAINEYASLQFGYSWAQQSYLAQQNASYNPNVNRVFVTLSFAFARPLHR
jgi:hypothetical protein